MTIRRNADSDIVDGGKLDVPAVATNGRVHSEGGMSGSEMVTCQAPPRVHLQAFQHRG